MAKTIIKLILDDSRRLTGKSLLLDDAGAIIDAFVSGIDKQLVVDQWMSFAKRMLVELGWQSEKTYYRIFEDGISIAISAPMDALYTACEINEAAWEFACAELTGKQREEDLTQAVVRIRECRDKEVNPTLLELINQAKQRNIPWLSDDDMFSLGHGASASVWPVTALPEPDTLNWKQYKSVPIALVTGTNGKSTSVRVLSQMIQQSGKCCGVTSTDFIRVGDNIIDYGDYSGPGGARTLLRHPDTDAAILEVARGGILRRGLPVDYVDAALITNIAEDHLGQYGINTVAALAKAKAVVAKALVAGHLVLNADDEHLVNLGPDLPVNKCWFSLNKDNPVIQTHISNGGAACFLHNGQLVYSNDHEETEIIAVKDIPMTLNGAARHNIHNALGGIGVAKSLGLDNKSIATALKQFSSNVDDNPGRGNQFEVKNAKVIMDFAHNVHSMDAMAITLANMSAKRKFLMLSMAGDRSDQQIEEATYSALAMKPDILVVAELKVYLRGRQPGEVPRLIADAAMAKGLPKENIIFVDSPFEGAKNIVEQLQASDLALLLALSDRDMIIDLLKNA
ncbi:MAG: Mur ligase family protein [Desulfobulbaceae bacterium]|nr:Mur ligase family protein [Desulfobulbaceae bacterium]